MGYGDNVGYDQAMSHNTDESQQAQEKPLNAASPAPVQDAAKEHPETVTPANPDEQKNARTIAAAAHGLGLVAPIIGALFVWLLKKDELPQIDRPCKEALNFQIFYCALLFILLVPTTCIPFAICITGPVLGVLILGIIVLEIIATVAVAEGKDYRYPVNIRLIS